MDFNEKLKTLRDDLNFFSRHCLKIKTKDEGIKPLVFNPIQFRTHQAIEQVRREGKKVKIVLLKSRQVGLSTYTEGRFFSKVFWTPAKNAFVMSEKSTSADNIFQMAKRYYDNLPAEMPKPKLITDRSDMMTFETDSTFRVGTAGSKSIGRSMTNNYLHGSEVGFWENADEIISGLFQTVPNNLESEIILESTANGVTGQGAFFFSVCTEGLDPRSEWTTLFFPWFEHPEYVSRLTDDFVLTDEEQELKRIYNITNEQIMWRRLKIAPDFKGREYLFAQEYPSSIQEAFVRTGNSLVGLKYLEKAKTNVMTDGGAPVMIGVDPARTGDRTVIIIRQGRVIIRMLRFDFMDEMKLAGMIARLINHYDVQRTFIDYGHGTGTYDRLCEQGFSSKVELVNFGESAFDSTKYVNRRVEMYDRVRDWFMQEGGVYIKDQECIEELYADLMLMPDVEVADSNGKLCLPPKKKIVKGSSINSTDFSDALGLTFATFVSYNANENTMPKINVRVKRSWEQ